MSDKYVGHYIQKNHEQISGEGRTTTDGLGGGLSSKIREAPRPSAYDQQDLAASLTDTLFVLTVPANVPRKVASPWDKCEAEEAVNTPTVPSAP